MEKRIALTGLGIGVATLAFLLFGIGNDPMYVYDESMYVIGARSLLHGAQDLNPVHPPLAKYLIAAGMRLCGDTPLGWRIAGATLGALALVAIFLWTYLLLHDYALALTAAGLTLLNNFLFVMSRVAMLDVFYFAFIIWGILAFTAAILLRISTTRRRLFIFASGLLFGLGTACKWNAVVTLAAVGLIAAILYVRKSPEVREIGLTMLAAGLVFVPVAAYALSYLPLCLRFHRPFSLMELVEMNKFIWRYHVTCPGNPALDVRWYQWFFRATPERGLSYLMGNFAVVWVGLFALAVCAWRFARHLYLGEGMVTLLYAANLLQWVVIPQKRLVYYYYFPPAMFLGVALVMVLSRANSPRLFGIRLNMVLLAAAAVFFLYCYPRMASLQAPFDCMLGCWS